MRCSGLAIAFAALLWQGGCEGRSGGEPAAAPAAGPAASPVRERGRIGADQLLVASCSGCHGANPTDDGIPSLAGRSTAELRDALMAFRDGDRRATLMNRLAAGYSDADIGRLARALGDR